jgi:hypothetical protein
VFLTEKISIGRPDIKPERASFAPVIKVIEPAKLPPQHVNKIEVKQLKQERRLEKEQTKSVINRGAPAKALVVKTVEQPKSPAEKVKERQQIRLEEKSTGSAAPAATEEKKGKQLGREEKGKSAVAPEIKGAGKGEEKSTGSAAPPETKDRRSGKQLSPEQKEKPVGGPSGAPETRSENKGGKQAVAQEKKKSTDQELKGGKKAQREAAGEKGKSGETSEGKPPQGKLD